MVDIKKIGTWILEWSPGKLAPDKERVPNDISEGILGYRVEYELVAAYRCLAYLMIQPSKFYYKLEHRRQEPIR